jgi:hypothetical protein
MPPFASLRVPAGEGPEEVRRGSTPSTACVRGGSRVKFARVRRALVGMNNLCGLVRLLATTRHLFDCADSYRVVRMLTGSIASPVFENADRSDEDVIAASSLLPRRQCARSAVGGESLRQALPAEPDGRTEGGSRRVFEVFLNRSRVPSRLTATRGSGGESSVSANRSCQSARALG